MLKVVFIFIILFKICIIYGQLPPVCGGSTVRYAVIGMLNSKYEWNVKGGTIINHTVNYDTIDIKWDDINDTTCIEVKEIPFKPDSIIKLCEYTTSINDVYVITPNIKFNTDTCIKKNTLLSLSEFVKYNWNNGDTTSKIIVYPKEQTITVKVQDKYGCYGSASIKVLDCRVNDCDIPAAFTPNNDGYNDKWVVKCTDYYPNATLIIYDNWGRKLYDGKYGDGWDGKLNGHILPMDAYVYILDLKNGDTPKIGMVTIIK